MGLKYLDFELKFEQQGAGFLARIRSPTGEASGAFVLPFSEDKLENLILKLGRLRRSTRRIDSPELAAAREFGGKLFEAVFSSEIRACLKSSLDEAARRPGIGLRLKLRLQETPELADLPWEFLFDSSLDRFLAQSSYTPIVRYVELTEPVLPLTITLPLRLLVMISSPIDSDYALLDTDQEKANIEKALEPLRSKGRVQVDWLEEATLRALSERLWKGEYHIFHFIGHGGFDARLGEGVLVLKDKLGKSWLAGAHRVGTALHDCRSLRLVVLNSCEGARNTRTDPFAGMAATIVRQGIPAVVAMQFEITDEAAVTLSSDFYTALAEGIPVDEALARARQGIYSQPNDVEWGTPVLYMRSPDGVLFNLASSNDDETPPVDLTAMVVQAAPTKIESTMATSEPKIVEIGTQQSEPAAIMANEVIISKPTIEIAAGVKCDRQAGGATSESTVGNEVTGDIRTKPGLSPGSWKAIVGVIALLVVAAVFWLSLRPAPELTVVRSTVTETNLPPTPSSAAKTTASSAAKTTPEPAKRPEGIPSDLEALDVLYKRGESLYYDSNGVRKNYDEAAERYREAAAQGQADAQYKLGLMYENGLGVPEDQTKAVEWFGKAAAQGQAGAQYKLGIRYAIGLGFAKDQAKAVELFRKAAAQGHANAQYSLKLRGLSW